MAEDAHITQLEMTERILKDLGITTSVREQWMRLPASNCEKAIDMYSQYFKQLFAVISEPEK